MKYPRKHRKSRSNPITPTLPTPSGFALVSTIVVMSLLSLVILGFLSLAAVESRSQSISKADLEARANAKIGLMMALSALQDEMGPDMRISMSSGLFDTNPETPSIDGVAQSRWTGSYDSWGTWLNANYQHPKTSTSLSIQDTYQAHRKPMFRRWLLSLPDGMEDDVTAPLNAANSADDNYVPIVAGGSLGALADSEPSSVTRAYKKQTTGNGSYAWWIGGENQKAKMPLNANTQSLSTEQWEIAQGTTPEIAVDALEGLDALTDDQSKSKKLLTFKSLEPSGTDLEKSSTYFFDLTASSFGLPTSTRSSGFKKDLSLLFNKDQLPGEFIDSQPTIREKSIRPMSPDLAAKNPSVPGRHFASWANMHRYYRMYLPGRDLPQNVTGGSTTLSWAGKAPFTKITAPLSSRGYRISDTYLRLPLLAKLTFIYSLQSIEIPNSNPKRYDCYLVYTPVYTFWNPYNVELRIPSGELRTLSLPYKILPLSYYKYKNGSLDGGLTPITVANRADYGSAFYADDTSTITFKPGELRLFSYRDNGTATGKQTRFLPGFDPQAIGGDKFRIFSNVSRNEKPEIVLTFGNPYDQSGNVWFGNTPGGLNNPFSWASGGGGNAAWLPGMYQHDWFRPSQVNTRIIPEGTAERGQWIFSDNEPTPVAFTEFVIKTSSEFEYESIGWNKDWRSKNWMQAPPYYFGSAQFISKDPAIANTQRLDNPYIVHFGPMSAAEMPKVVPHLGNNALLGSGTSPREKITAAPMLELPSAPVSNLAGFSNMRINPGSTDKSQFVSGGGAWNSLSGAQLKEISYQSGVTGPALGNSFLHPMLPGNDIYRFYDNSKSHDVSSGSSNNTTERDNKVYNDYWDHAFLLNDSLWDDFFVSSFADQSRPTDTSANDLSTYLRKVVEDGEPLTNKRLRFTGSAKPTADILSDLSGAQGYLNAARYLMIDGAFNVNSISVDAWHAMFAGIRERSVVYRDEGTLKVASIPSDRKIALSRFTTEISDKETENPEEGVTIANGLRAWTGVRYLDDAQLRKLAEECVEQVKRRGPFLNLSEFINRRLSNDQLGLKGAIQSAIDYDDASPDPDSINFRFKNGPDYMIEADQLIENQYETPEAALGSRFTGIPGYVIQSDLLRPLAGALTVRDDTFKIRAYGESRDANGNILSQVWCEAVVQRVPEYLDPSDDATETPRQLDTDGTFQDQTTLSDTNKKFGRKFKIRSFRWLNPQEI